MSRFYCYSGCEGAKDVKRDATKKVMDNIRGFN